MGFEIITDGISYLHGQSLLGLVLLFWYNLIFDIPRYSLSFLAFGAGGLVAGMRGERTGGGGHEHWDSPVRMPRRDGRFRVSLIVAGHNEADSIERCVDSLREQSFNDFEIILVSDGSTDNMAEVCTDLVRRGKAHKFFETDLRCGKSAAVNLADRLAEGEFIINVDCDCSYERDSMANILAPFSDPRVGAVSGDILPRNGDKTLIASFQLIEYLISISLGKMVSDMLGQVSCASGAFGAFRKTALAQIGGCDVGGGEDFDLTQRMRAQGWRIRFAGDALCFTDVPDSRKALTGQRLRWDRDIFRLRLRKYARLMNPFAKSFQMSETWHQLDFLLFNLLGAVVFPFYLLWLFATYGSFAFSVLVAAQLGLVFLDAFSFLLAVALTKRWHLLPYLAFVPGYGIFNGYYMRFVRLVAYLRELIFDESRSDHYVPSRARYARKW